MQRQAGLPGGDREPEQGSLTSGDFRWALFSLDEIISFFASFGNKSNPAFLGNAGKRRALQYQHGVAQTLRADGGEGEPGFDEGGGK